MPAVIKSLDQMRSLLDANVQVLRNDAAVCGHNNDHLRAMENDQLATLLEAADLIVGQVINRILLEKQEHDDVSSES